MKEVLQKEIKKWFRELYKSIKKDPRRILIIFIAPMIIYAIANALLPFGAITMVGYIFACIYGFSKILDDPYRMVMWGLGYAIGALAVSLILSSALLLLSKGEATSIFAGGVILYVCVVFWLKARKLKKK